MSVDQASSELHFSAETHQVFNQSSALENYNVYASDYVLQEVLSHYDVNDTAQLIAYGERCGRADVIQWGFDANEHKPQFESHDRFGHRVDLVKFHPAYHQLMNMALTEGIHSGPWQPNVKNAHLKRAALSYMQSQIDAGHGCPLTMTFASVPTIKLSPRLAEIWLPKILNTAYQPENVPYFEKAAVTIGMGMTEKQGGSDVRANTTVAEPLNDSGNGALYTINGHKWFLSAPMCDAFLMLAQAPGGLSCFLVPRWREDGQKNGLYVQRLKNKMGNVSNASSELELRQAQGWMVGEEGRGVAAIIEMVALTRFDCMVGSTAGQRQAVVQAVNHARQRSSFGARLIDQALMQNVLADLQLEVEGSLALTMRMAKALDNDDDPAEQLLMRLGTAVGKFWICKRTPAHAYEAMECLGGNGVIENCIMPRLYREAPINAIWEGSGNIQALDVLRALQKAPAVLDRWFVELVKTAGRNVLLDNAVNSLKETFAKTSNLEFRARYLIEQLALTMQASLLIESAPSAIAEAFIRSRLSGGQAIYGCLPECADVQAILARVLPDNP
ncbi:acyl-CoA dehydrogenase family protein [Zhongshania aliphaticivorans]|uniref:acyl-CoA dehydrogenase family protein n=1 Tax=Zhongshania aliphaticivorans TaxID=1470434 RepID=UPI0012E55945|nr:acyl-CoA dehydrogenase family protein [Zhongshania aliphaticivorans]CAA0078822.1 Putative acyl-CoA dehydrogenase AidB [Zhongshania aliphaticivorans]